jgi:hypothetical protein
LVSTEKKKTVLEAEKKIAKVKNALKLTLNEAKNRRASGEKGCVRPLIFKLGASWDWSGSLPGRFTPEKRDSDYLGIGMLRNGVEEQNFCALNNESCVVQIKLILKL